MLFHLIIFLQGKEVKMLAFLLLQNKLGRVGLVTANCRGDGRLLQRRRQNLKQKVTTNDSALRRKNVIINEMIS